MNGQINQLYPASFLTVPYCNNFFNAVSIRAAPAMTICALEKTHKVVHVYIFDMSYL